jgi:hypothetical protein
VTVLTALWAGRAAAELLGCEDAPAAIDTGAGSASLVELHPDTATKTSGSKKRLKFMSEAFVIPVSQRRRIFSAVTSPKNLGEAYDVKQM